MSFVVIQSALEILLGRARIALLHLHETHQGQPLGILGRVLDHGSQIAGGILVLARFHLNFDQFALQFQALGIRDHLFEHFDGAIPLPRTEVESHEFLAEENAAGGLGHGLLEGRFGLRQLALSLVVAGLHRPGLRPGLPRLARLHGANHLESVFVLAHARPDVRQADVQQRLVRPFLDCLDQPVAGLAEKDLFAGGVILAAARLGNAGIVADQRQPGGDVAALAIGLLLASGCHLRRIAELLFNAAHRLNEPSVLGMQAQGFGRGGPGVLGLTDRGVAFDQTAQHVQGVGPELGACS